MATKNCKMPIGKFCGSEFKNDSFNSQITFRILSRSWPAKPLIASKFHGTSLVTKNRSIYASDSMSFRKDTKPLWAPMLAYLMVPTIYLILAGSSSSVALIFLWQTKINQVQFSGILKSNCYVFRLNITMNEICIVQSLQPIKQLDANHWHSLKWERSFVAFEKRPQRWPKQFNGHEI